jgi:hypothetical protein
LGEVASFRAFAGLIENFIDAALFLDGQCLEDGPARLPLGLRGYWMRRRNGLASLYNVLDTVDTWIQIENYSNK